MTLKEKLSTYGDFIDVAILAHGFARHMRDYDILFEAMWGNEEWADNKGTYRLRFTHCPEVLVVTNLSDANWKQAWSDAFTNYADWQTAGEPEGFVWGVCWSNAYPGITYVDNSQRALKWTERLGVTMHEVTLETEAFLLQIIFHDFSVKKLTDEVSVIDKVMFPIESK
jgi:hypothetical protein